MITICVLKSDSSHIIMVLVYVDDLLITCNNAQMISKLKFDLQQSFRMKDLGPLKYFLGIELVRSESGIHLCQRKYSLELIVELGLSSVKPCKTLMEVNLKLTSTEYDNLFWQNRKDTVMSNPTSYKRLIGKLIYLTVIRPDISYVVQHLSQFMQSPKTL